MSAPWAFGRNAPRLARAGYDPIPISLPKEGDKDAGKKPAASLLGWTKGCPRERWAEFADYGVGLLTRDLPTVDIDTMDQAIGDALQELVDRHIGDAPVRYGQFPKRATPCRLEGERFDKLKVSWEAIPGSGDEGRDKDPGVEILASKQQFVALGIHPGTRQPYRWERDPDLDIPRALLPPLDEAMARRFMDVVADFITEIGGKIKTRPARATPVTTGAGNVIRFRPQNYGKDQSEFERIADALERLGNPELDYDDWIRIGIGIKGALGDAGISLWADWSQKAEKNNPRVTEQKWRTFRPDRAGAGLVFKVLKERSK